MNNCNIWRGSLILFSLFFITCSREVAGLNDTNNSQRISTVDSTNSANAIELTDQDILNEIKKHSPLNGAKVPEGIQYQIGAAHADGKYYFTNEPFIIEGAKAIQNIGLGTIKLWLYPDKIAPESYRFNSNWNLPKKPTVIDVLSHPYYQSVLNMPFHTIVLSTESTINLKKAAWEGQPADYITEEEMIYNVAKYLLQTYASQDKTFILENWAGDWLLRGINVQWKNPKNIPANLEQRIAVMRKWFQARQDGVTRARNEVKNTRAKIYHAAEINKVLECMDGIPGIASDVLPYIKVDMVSWNSYDALHSPVAYWRALDYIKKQMNVTGAYPGVPIFIAEVGFAENNGSVRGILSHGDKIDKKEVIVRWDEILAATIAHKIPYFIQWEVYCNAPKNIIEGKEVYSADELKGIWLIRPDGSLGYGAQYFKMLLQHAGKVIKEPFEYLGL